MYSRYENRIEALKELQHRHFKVGRSKFYRDCALGLCKLEADGSILDDSLEKYIKDPLARIKRLDKLHEERKIKASGHDTAFLVIPLDLSLIWERLFQLKDSLSVDQSGDKSDEQ